MEESLVHIASLNDKEGPDNAISFPVGENHCYVSVSVAFLVFGLCLVSSVSVVFRISHELVSPYLDVFMRLMVLDTP